MKIDAAIVHEPNGKFTIEQVELDDIRADEVLVRMVATGICHTDVAIVEQILPLPMPIVLGHEGSGIVEKVGANVTRVAPGDRVVLTFQTCGACQPCTHDHPSYCDQYGLLNFFTRRPDGSATIEQDGAPVGGSFFGQSSFGTFSIAHERNAIKVRDDAPLELLGPLGCGISTGAGTVMNVLKPGPYATIAIFGTGAVGSAALMAAKALGMKKIIAIDRVESRLSLARELGATHTIDTSKEDLAQALAAQGGLDFALDTSGVPKLISAAVDALKSRGTCAIVGASHEGQVTLNILPMIGGKTLMGVTNGDCVPETFIPQLIDMYMDGRFPMDKLTAFYSLDQINEAVADSNSGKTIKPIIRF